MDRRSRMSTQGRRLDFVLAGPTVLIRIKVSEVVIDERLDRLTVTLSAVRVWSVARW
jgi:hypothetical protein